MKIIDQTSTASSAIIVTDNLLADISKTSVFVNDVQISATYSPSVPWYSLIEDTNPRGRALIQIYNLSSGTCYVFSATTYTDPGIEFWKDDFNPAAADLSLQGGQWENGEKTTALSTTTNETVIDGGEFMAPYNDFAPEEFVPGHTTDSLGIEVYTKADDSYATVLSGSFFVVATATTSTYSITINPVSAAGYLLNFNNTIFQRSTTTNFTTSNQYFIQGKNIVLPPQTNSGVAYYTYVKIGGNGLIDENTVQVYTTTTSRIIVESLANINSVQKTFVLANGQEVQESSTSGIFGYITTSSWDSNISHDDSNRAAVYLHDIPAGDWTVSAWFFDRTDIKINKIKEDFYTVNSGTQTITLNTPVLNTLPLSDKVIVEIATGTNSTIRTRLVPPNVSNYFVQNSNRVFNFFDNGHTPIGPYTPNNILVYANGVQIRSGYDFDYDFANYKIVLQPNLYPDGTYISIVNACRENGNLYDYIINGNILRFEPSPLVVDSSVKVMTFSIHDTLFMETENFNWNSSRAFTFIRPILDESYLWVYLDGNPLTPSIDYVVLPDFRTIQLSFSLPITGTPRLVATSIKKPDIPSKVYGYRYFQDFYNRITYKRLSSYHTTFLIDYFLENNNVLFVNEESRLSSANPSKNIPGVVLIDRERIEFFGRGDNFLTDLRRGTGGTGPSFLSQPGTKVIDQGVLQTIPGTSETTYIYNTATVSTITSYNIPAFNSTTNVGITLDTEIDSVDQVYVYYGGYQLSKNSRWVYESSTSTILIEDPPEFYFTATQIISLNTASLRFAAGIEDGLRLSVVHKKGRIWAGNESLLTSNDIPAKFIRRSAAELPDVYFYGGDSRLLDEKFEPLSVLRLDDFKYEILRIE